MSIWLHQKGRHKHRKGDVEKLKQGQRVSFDEATDPRNGKACAQNIEPIKT
jgi:cold shock CspA family protein